MSRRPRIILPGVSLHIIQRENNRQSCFFADEDYRFYPEWLEESSRSAGCSSDLITHHVLQQNLAHDDDERKLANRDLFRHELERGEIDEIRKAADGSDASGSGRFVDEISAMLGRRVTQGKAGIPEKNLL